MLSAVLSYLHTCAGTPCRATRVAADLVARAIRNAIRANRFARIIRNWHPYFSSASGRFARITRISDSRESPDSRESCESIRTNHATTPAAAADFLRMLGFSRCSSGIALHPPKRPCRTSPPWTARSVARQAGAPKRCRATGGCSSHTCGCRATLCN